MSAPRQGAETRLPGEPETLQPILKKRKREPRATLACEPCRARKGKCDQLQPCSNCQRHNVTCTFRQPETGSQGSRKAAAISKSNRARTVVPIQPATFIPIRSYREPRNHQANELQNVSLEIDNQLDVQAGHRNSAQLVAINESDIGKVDTPHDPGTDHLDEVNVHTQGTEYYGPTGAFSFLQRLRSRARSKQAGAATSVVSRPPSADDLQRLSVVNFLHSPDYPVDDSATARTLSFSEASPSNAGVDSTEGLVRHTPSDERTERECIRLYFQNLHLMHPVIDETSFLESCNRKIWDRDRNLNSLSSSSRGPFISLFNAVLALGAITAGDDAWFMRNSEHGDDAQNRNPSIYLPLRLAKFYFERCKANLGDIFETCSLESTQTLFLMAVFCQNALKPHSCYMYSGMAVRSALAIGIANDTRQASSDASLLWWCIYSHEMEMCASVGRDTGLAESGSYEAPLPPQELSLSSNTACRNIISTMIPLAEIQRRLSIEIYQAKSTTTLEKSTKSLILDQALDDWKAGLAPLLDLETTSLTEPEWQTKQKIALSLRFCNHRILLHRPFLIAATAENKPELYMIHVKACVDASRKTIDLLYNAYLYRPYFRTWWYNTTYALYASMILLYVVLSNLQPGIEVELLQDVEKSLAIFNAMNAVAVSRRCAEVIKEVLDIAKGLHESRQRMHAPTRDTGTEDSTPRLTNVTPLPAQEIPIFENAANGENGMNDFDFIFNNFATDDLFTGLLDINPVEDLNGDGGTGILDGW